MRNLILMLSILVGSVTYATAQYSSNDTRGQFQIGLKAGANYANVYDSEGEDFRADGKFGFAGGLFITVPLGLVFGFQPEILFSQKGFKATGRVLSGAYELTRTTTFIDVPLLLAVKPIPNVTVLAGPQFSFLTRQKDVFANEINSFEQIQEFKNEDVRKNILGLAVGLDVNVGHLVVGGRAGWDLSRNNGDGTSNTPRYKNGWVQATLGYRFL